jgi:arylsulfatase A-like enzyme
MSPPRLCLALSLACLALLAAAGEARAERPGRPPNFVFILVDDLGWADLGCYGSTFHETPNLDRLASSGMRFTHGYAAGPVCSPTRASIMTGKYPARMGTTEWFSGKREGKLRPAPYTDRLPLEEMTIAEILHRAGYRTGFFGKWHLGGKGFGPLQQGFEVNKGGNQRGSPASYFSPYKNPDLPDGPKGEHLGDRITDEAIRFMEQHKDRPFLLYLSYYDVHIPLQAKKELVARYEAKAKKQGGKGERFAAEGDKKDRLVQDHAVYAAMMETLDTNVGRLMKRLEELGLAEDTVVIFTSDNGGLSTSEGLPTSNRPLRAGKGWLYEGGVRVPFIIRWPGHTKRGGTSDVPVISTDFAPTMIEMARLKPLPKQHVDGVSLVPLLEGRGRPAPRELYWHYPHYSNQGGRPSGSVRSGDLVLIEHFEDGRLELYNVRQDVGQRNDLSKTMPERAAELHRMLRDWRQSVGAKMPAAK